jgi:RHS repeat-associated protein
MQMPGRNGTISGGEYRYAFNGMETDKEISGRGNSYTTQFRQYDPRLGRWKSIDPLAGMFPNQSPFCAFDNNPIYYTDPSGLAAEGDGDKDKKGNGFKKKRNKDGSLSDKDADPTVADEVEIVITVTKEQSEHANKNRREQGIPSWQFEQLSKTRQDELMRRFERMSRNQSSIAWSKGTWELYHAIYYGRDNYDKYFTAYNATFGQSFADNWNKGYQSWEDGSIGKDWSQIAAYGIGSSFASVIVAPALGEASGFLITQAPSFLASPFVGLTSGNTVIQLTSIYQLGSAFADITVQMTNILIDPTLSASDYNFGSTFGALYFKNPWVGGLFGAGNSYLNGDSGTLIISNYVVNGFSSGLSQKIKVTTLLKNPYAQHAWGSTLTPLLIGAGNSGINQNNR